MFVSLREKDPGRKCFRNVKFHLIQGCRKICLS